MAKKSKNCLTFLNRTKHFCADLELVDILSIANMRNALAEKDDSTLFFYMKKGKYPILEARKNDDDNRRMAIQHLKATLYSSILKDLYEEFTTYLKSLIYEAAIHCRQPERIAAMDSKHKLNYEAKDILKAGSWDNVVSMVVDSIFQALESERSTINLIKKTDAKLGLNISDAIIQDALPFLEARHLLVHSDGKANEEFRHNFPNLKYDHNNYLDIDYDIINLALEKVTALVFEFDLKAISARILDPQ